MLLNLILHNEAVILINSAISIISFFSLMFVGITILSVCVGGANEQRREGQEIYDFYPTRIRHGYLLLLFAVLVLLFGLSFLLITGISLLVYGMYKFAIIFKDGFTYL